MNKEIIEIKLDIAEPRNVLKIELQRIIDLVTFGLHSSDFESSDMMETPGAVISYGISPETMFTWDEARDAFRVWIVGAGLREAVETFSVFLEGINYFCVASRLQNEEQPLNMDKWAERINSAEKSFHHNGLPRKIDILRKYSSKLLPSLAESLLQINKARNCLVHRKGVVSEKDAVGGELLISWIAMDITLDQNAQDDTSKRDIFRVETFTNSSSPLKPPRIDAREQTKKPVVRHVNKFKIFKLGETIKFTAQEFAEICFTLLILANQVEMNLLKYLNNQGINISIQSYLLRNGSLDDE